MKRLFAGTAMLAAMAWLTAAEVAAQQGSRTSGGTTTTTTTGCITATGNSGTRTPTPTRDTGSRPNIDPQAGLDGTKLKKNNTKTNDSPIPRPEGGAGRR